MTVPYGKIYLINILGIYFGGNVKERDDLNYRETLNSIKKSLNLWKWRGLSLLGRIEIIKPLPIVNLCLGHQPCLFLKNF